MRKNYIAIAMLAASVLSFHAPASAFASGNGYDEGVDSTISELPDLKKEMDALIADKFSDVLQGWISEYGDLVKIQNGLYKVGSSEIYLLDKDLDDAYDVVFQKSGDVFFLNDVDFGPTRFVPTANSEELISQYKKIEQ